MKPSDRSGGRATARNSPHAGFVLAEVIVAAVLVSVGLLAIVATANYARERLRIAAIDETVTRAAAMTLDSLRAIGAADGGAVAQDGLLLEWRIDGGGAVELVVRFPDGGGLRSRRYVTRIDPGARP